ncbi:MAG TPA: S8 family serine peptidase [Rubrivivax sp.]
MLSSSPATLCGAPHCFAFFSGTSMAAPHLAGSAAVVRGQKPQWSAAEVRSAIVNTAQRGVLKSSAKAEPVDDVSIVGTGLENLLAAVNATVALDPVSISFGGVPWGSGQTRTQTMTLSNLSGSAKTFSLAVGAQPAGVSYSVSPSTLALAAGESKSVTVTMSAAVGANGHQQASLFVSEGGAPSAHAVLFTLIK